MKKILIISLFALLLIFSAAPSLSLAQTSQNSLPTYVSSVDDIIKVLNKLIDWMFSLLLVVSVLFIIYAAFLYVTGGSEPEKISSANRQLIYAAIAIMIGLLAKGVVFVMKQLVGA